jgi:hypothetical protein
MKLQHYRVGKVLVNTEINGRQSLLLHRVLQDEL